MPPDRSLTGPHVFCIQETIGLLIDDIYIALPPSELMFLHLPSLNSQESCVVGHVEAVISPRLPQECHGSVQTKTLIAQVPVKQLKH